MLSNAMLQARNYNLYNEANNLDEAWHNMRCHVPKGKTNEFFAYLMVYHNTLVREVSNQI